MNSKVVLQQWLDAQCARDWELGTSLLSAHVVINGQELSASEYIHHLQSLTANTVNWTASIDLLIQDDDDAKLAARVTHSTSSDDVVPPRTSWVEHLFLWTSRGKMSKLISLNDRQYLNEQATTVASTPAASQNTVNESKNSLGSLYTEYIDTINTLTMGDNLDKYCHPVVTHNDHTYSIDEYRMMIESSFDDIKGLRFAINDFVIDSKSQYIGALLAFTGTPVKAFRGILPTGRDVQFSEHAFYRLRDGKIEQVWSLLDLESFKRSITG
ncbi:SnoaL-like polyketide cyclase [Pochonia chlamydosporia 170]|uniref:SnoaL-like polyketide cyclase n=1 Tax=Pochonia chlamydosporia 170 TaxID=1380566 RepID=A0A179G3X0_METCM|nr:SnoaL-like polyketide cyclase [Pochonia chlamydosporia 170]OAQ72043.1 SnoaL-like polyketide cyclase [Pochonia chlamydosporia 170]